MIPIQLTIKGLYSYQGLTNIDFEPLLDAGLFGIFGAVGSGKSAILEAMMLVLFDRTTRLNKAGDDRYYNMMNLQSNELIIDFIFKAGTNHQNKYRFYFKARRHTKDFGKVEVKDRSYYLWKGNDWVPIDDHQVVGMTYENFMQTVIIPQGKFREFIDQKPAARTQMLKELFHLEKYELAPQAYALLHETKDQLTFVEGQLSQFAELNAELLREMQKQAQLLDSQIGSESEKVNDLTKKEANLEALRLKVQELQEAAATLKILRDEQEFYQLKEHQLRRFEKAQRLFLSKIDLQQGYLEELKLKQREVRSLEENIQLQKTTFEKGQQALEQAQQQLLKKETWQQESADLRVLVEYQVRKKELEAISQKWETNNLENSQLKQQEEELSTNIGLIEEKVKAHGDAQGHYQQWLSATRWWEKEEELEERQRTYQQEWEQIDQEVQAMVREHRLLAVNEASLKNVTIEIQQLQNQLQSLKIQEDWEVHAQHLKDGKPCPLCGSPNHPNILSTQQLASQIHPIQEKLEKLIIEEKTLREKIEKNKILDNSIKLKSHQGQQTKKKWEDAGIQLNQHQQAFPVEDWESERPANWQAILDDKKELANQGAQFQKQLNQMQESYRQLNDRLLKSSSRLNETAQLRQKHSGALEQKLNSLRALSAQDYQEYSREQLLELQKEKDQQIKQAHRNFELTSKSLQETSQELTRLQTLEEALQQQVQGLLEKSRELEQELGKLCKSESFQNLDEVQKILALKLDADQERKELSDFRENMSLATAKVTQLQKTIGKSSYDEVQHTDTKAELESLVAKLEQHKQQLAGIQHNLREKQQQLKHKQELLEKQQTLTVRKQHIQEISNLLRGNGFINFISSTYLQNLCAAANNRFSKLTGNRLSLELNEHNDFMVRDYLNDGKLRLLKTLSGGQIFQASLCLSLSLAENVKSFNQADQSFFFLDEGFGSLDKASMGLVIETLKSLQKENRVVGIISHVEELQQEIDVYLSVRQVGEKGSSIMPSWEIEN